MRGRIYHPDGPTVQVRNGGLPYPKPTTQQCHFIKQKKGWPEVSSAHVTSDGHLPEFTIYHTQTYRLHTLYQILTLTLLQSFRIDWKCKFTFQWQSLKKCALEGIYIGNRLCENTIGSGRHCHYTNQFISRLLTPFFWVSLDLT